MKVLCRRCADVVVGSVGADRAATRRMRDATTPTSSPAPAQAIVRRLTSDSTRSRLIYRGFPSALGNREKTLFFIAHSNWIAMLLCNDTPDKLYWDLVQLRFTLFAHFYCLVHGNFIVTRQVCFADYYRGEEIAFFLNVRSNLFYFSYCSCTQLTFIFARNIL